MAEEMDRLDRWKDDIVRRMGRGELETERIPSVIKRCPACHRLSLEYDPNTGRISCSRCGFSENLPIIKS